MKNKIILFNPRSANYNHRIPNSILQIAASVHGKHGYVLVDGNREYDPWKTIMKYASTGDFKYFACTVMPGPQLKQAIPYTKEIKFLYPHMITIWGGYFASNQYKVSIQSGYVDYIIYGPGDKAFPDLLYNIENNISVGTVKNLVYINEKGTTIKTEKEALSDQDALPMLPYDTLHTFYPLQFYFPKTYLGRHTLAYHSSIGCPFKCAFCAVVPIYEAKWRGKSAQNIFNDVQRLKEKFDIDAIEFHDNNFFVSEKRVVEFSHLIMDQNISWWGEGRIDTLDQYSDDSLSLMKKAGCKMIFFGAESGNDAILSSIDKGGKQTADQILKFAKRLKKVGIVPEYSFVVGFPGVDEESVYKSIHDDIDFIKKVKEVNPATEIIIYTFSPVPTENSELFKSITKEGFAFPSTLEDWLSPFWTNFDLRKNPLTPWLKPYMVNKIKNFETVLNGYYPTITDIKLSGFKRKMIKLISSWRYYTGFYHFPYEIKFLQKYWLKYRQPEIEGF